ncbi:AraC family transcriptional regulator [bacterium]|jgi:AraC-like DNA-binding protein|nr:AraC family transcriptional regulator [bacterium]
MRTNALKQLHNKKYKPSNKLIKYIDAYWSIENVSKNSISIPIVPDGCMDIIYKNGDLIFVGAMIESKIVEILPFDYSFGIRFKPAIFPHLVKIDSNKYINEVVSLEFLSQDLFNQIIINKNDELQTVDYLNQLFELLFEKIELNQKIIKAIDKIINHRGNISLKELEGYIDLSNRQLQRLFQNYLGYSPKKFCNIVRFFDLFKELIKNNTDNLSSKAYEFGYCDQSHLNKEFKKFSNLFPTHELMSIFYKTK